MLNRIKKMGLGMILISSLFLCSLNVYAKDDIKEKQQTRTVKVTADIGLNIRPTPGTEKDPVDTVPYGTQLEVIKDDVIQNWSSIKYQDEVRYVCNEYIIDLEEWEQEEEKQQETNTQSYLGSFRITHYCNCSICCGVWAGGGTANGAYPTSNHTIATGEEFPFGTKLMINGQVYVVEDRGVGNGCIDIYCDSHSEALNRGMYYTDVYLVKE